MTDYVAAMNTGLRVLMAISDRVKPAPNDVRELRRLAPEFSDLRSPYTFHFRDDPHSVVKDRHAWAAEDAPDYEYPRVAAGTASLISPRHYGMASFKLSQASEQTDAKG